jgi:hypothetical protein
MKKKLSMAAALVVGALLVAVVARTQPPASGSPYAFPYHGYVQDGATAADGLYDFQFTIYPSSDPAAAPVWTERQDSISVVGGNFSVALGEGVTSVGAFPSIFALDQMYLGIELCERTSPPSACFLTALAGRQRIMSVPAAVSSVPTGPVGEIMAIDFDAPDPDPAFWLESDGRAIPASSRMGRHLTSRGLPLVTNDLTDDRFLMGAAATGRGGDNDGHTHAFALTAENPVAGSALATHQHNVVTWLGATQQVEDANVETVANDVLGTRTTSGPNGGNAGVAHTHPVSGTVGSGLASGDAAGSNRPRYQAVRYFVKIN